MGNRVRAEKRAASLASRNGGGLASTRVSLLDRRGRAGADNSIIQLVAGENDPPRCEGSRRQDVKIER